MKFFLFFFMGFLVLFSNPAQAQETSGDFANGSIMIGDDTRDCDSSLAGSMRYNQTTEKIQFCKGTRWVDFAPQILGCSVCPEGDLSAPNNSGCARLFGEDPTDIDDVGIYAGDVPGTTTDFFVQRCDMGMTYNATTDLCEGTRTKPYWKEDGTDSVTTSLSNGAAWTSTYAIDGPGLTAELVADTSGSHPAAEACAALTSGDWYLPAESELDVIYSNLVATDDDDNPLTTVQQNTGGTYVGTVGPLRDGFYTVGTYYVTDSYWASSEHYTGYGWVLLFYNGLQHDRPKDEGHYVRCARRD